MLKKLKDELSIGFEFKNNLWKKKIINVTVP